MKTNKKVNDKGTVSECTWMKTILWTDNFPMWELKLLNFLVDSILIIWKTLIPRGQSLFMKFLLGNLATFLSFLSGN